MTALDVYNKPELLAQIKADFEKDVAETWTCLNDIDISKKNFILFILEMMCMKKKDLQRSVRKEGSEFLKG
jgi:hypothetical protein